MGKRFISTKEYRELGPVAYHQWRDTGGNCRLIHGYALSFYFEFESDSLDLRNWVVDFGGLRPLKEKLEEWFDHKLLLAQDDPNFDDIMKLQDLKLAEITVVEATGCEALSDFLYKFIVEAKQTGNFGLKAYVIPFLAPVQGQEFPLK